ncbi:MAG: DUF3817 domain-containing protein [Verrucomicrobiota bacterium]
MLRNLRIIGFIEGISTLILFFVAMPLKYMADMPMAVTIFGTLHGVLFVGLCVAFAIAMFFGPVTFRIAFIGVVGAVFPFGPFVVDHYWLKPLEAESQQ